MDDVCPRCASELPGDGEAIWYAVGKLYCSQDCAQRAAGSGPATVPWPRAITS